MNSRDIMNSNESHQILSEHEIWLRLLDHIQHENVLMKNRLAEIIKNETNNNLLEQLEYFQTQFIEKDVIISLIRYDIAEESKVIKDNEFNEKASIRHERLKKDMELMEQEFSRLRADFDKYLPGYLISSAC